MGGPDIDGRMILAEWLFVETVDDLRRRSTDPDTLSRYELLGIALLLRKLLLEKRSLVDVVRYVRREVPIEFRIVPWSPDSAPAGATLPPYLLRLGGPALIGGPDSEPVTKPQKFIKAIVGEAGGEPLTVQQLVLYYAHVEGGVHLGEPEEPEQAIMSPMGSLLLGHSNGQIQTLAYVAAIVADALTPLRDSILAQPAYHRLIHIPDENGVLMNHWTSKYRDPRSRSDAP